MAIQTGVNTGKGNGLLLDGTKPLPGPMQRYRKTFMVHQTFIRWVLCILFKIVKSQIRHLGLVIGNVRHVRWFSWTLPMLIYHQKDLMAFTSGPTFIKPDQRNPWIKDQLWNDLLSTILHLQLPNFVSCGRDKPSHMTQNLVTVGVKL